MRVLIFILLVGLTLGCNKKKYFDGPNQYQDDFESYTDKTELIDGDNVLWSFNQVTKSDNSHYLDTNLAHNGNKSYHFSAIKSDEQASKCSLVKQKMAFYEDETVHITAWYFLHETELSDWLFIMDLEEQASISAGPGIRLAIVNNKLTVEHKYNKPNLFQNKTELDFPRQQWVKVDLEVKLSQKNKGYIKLWQNDTLVLEQNDWRTLPKDFLYFQQGTKGMYTSVEFGISANTKENSVKLNIDDIEVYIK